MPADEPSLQSWIIDHKAGNCVRAAELQDPQQLWAQWVSLYWFVLIYLKIGFKPCT